MSVIKYIALGTMVSLIVLALTPVVVCCAPFVLIGYIWTYKKGSTVKSKGVFNVLEFAKNNKKYKQAVNN